MYDQPGPMFVVGLNYCREDEIKFAECTDQFSTALTSVKLFNNNITSDKCILFFILNDHALHLYTHTHLYANSESSGEHGGSKTHMQS